MSCERKGAEMSDEIREMIYSQVYEEKKQINREIRKYSWKNANKQKYSQV